MFFDKMYRRQRFEAIVNKIDNYKNVNEFRNIIISNYHGFPAAPTRNLYVFKQPAKYLEEEKKLVGELNQSDQREDNVLLEKAYLNTFWEMFRLKLGVQAILFGMLTYTGVTVYLRVFNVSYFRVVCGTGLALQAYVTYLS